MRPCTYKDSVDGKIKECPRYGVECTLKNCPLGLW
jgi:hypothetical protein